MPWIEEERRGRLPAALFLCDPDGIPFIETHSVNRYTVGRSHEGEVHMLEELRPAIEDLEAKVKETWRYL